MTIVRDIFRGLLIIGASVAFVGLLLGVIWAMLHFFATSLVIGLILVLFVFFAAWAIGADVRDLEDLEEDKFSQDSPPDAP